MEEILLKNLEFTLEKIGLYIREVEDTYSFLSFPFKLRLIYFIISLLVSAVIKIKKPIKTYFTLSNSFCRNGYPDERSKVKNILGYGYGKVLIREV